MAKEKINIFQEYRRINLKFWQFPHAPYGLFSVPMILVTYSIASAFVIQNLIENALRYSPSGSRVEINIERLNQQLRWSS